MKEDIPIKETSYERLKYTCKALEADCKHCNLSLPSAISDDMNMLRDEWTLLLKLLDELPIKESLRSEVKEKPAVTEVFVKGM